MSEMFNLTPGFNRKPHEIALAWLLDQNLKPGDVIRGADLDAALCLIDPDTLAPGRKPQQQWALARLSEIVLLRDLYEAETGEVLVSVRGGGWLVCPRDEVSETLMSDFFGTLYRLYRKTQLRLSRATTEGVSFEENQRRNASLLKIAALRSFTMRERRERLTD